MSDFWESVERMRAGIPPPNSTGKIKVETVVNLGTTNQLTQTPPPPNFPTALRNRISTLILVGGVVGGVVGFAINNSTLMGIVAGGAIISTISTRRPTSTAKSRIDKLVEYYSKQPCGETIVAKLLEIKELDNNGQR